MIDRRNWQMAFLKASFNQFLPVADEIETLAPALAQGGLNPEYPWLDKSGQICVPLDYSFPLTKLRQSPQGLHNPILLPRLPNLSPPAV